MNAKILTLTLTGVAMVVFGLGAAETVIPQGANVAPNGDRNDRLAR